MIYHRYCSAQSRAHILLSIAHTCTLSLALLSRAFAYISPDFLHGHTAVFCMLMTSIFSTTKSPTSSFPSSRMAGSMLNVSLSSSKLRVAMFL